MSKEETLKKVELKVHVNCCDGCKKKVLKALNIKGVLKTEIHPTLPKVTVTGTVDFGILIKKLAKCGKASELLQIDNIPQSTDKELKKISDSIKDNSKENSKEQTGNNTEKKNESSVPQVSCLVNHGTVPARSSLTEAFTVPMPVYSVVAEPCCGRRLCCYDVPAGYQNCPPIMVPVTSPQSTVMADYFNDDNTMGCHVM